jgi:hypothetical protein
MSTPGATKTMDSSTKAVRSVTRRIGLESAKPELAATASWRVRPRFRCAEDSTSPCARFTRNGYHTRMLSPVHVFLAWVAGRRTRICRDTEETADTDPPTRKNRAPSVAADAKDEIGTGPGTQGGGGRAILTTMAPLPCFLAAHTRARGLRGCLA